MSAGTDSPAPSAPADSPATAEGAAYGRALLARIAAGMGGHCWPALRQAWAGIAGPHCGRHGRALLARIAAGMGGPGELVALVQFLHSGPMLYGGCVAIFDALRILATQGGAR